MKLKSERSEENSQTKWNSRYKTTNGERMWTEWNAVRRPHHSSPLTAEPECYLAEYQGLRTYISKQLSLSSNFSLSIFPVYHCRREELNTVKRCLLRWLLPCSLCCLWLEKDRASSSSSLSLSLAWRLVFIFLCKRVQSLPWLRRSNCCYIVAQVPFPFTPSSIQTKPPPPPLLPLFHEHYHQHQKWFQQLL